MNSDRVRYTKLGQSLHKRIVSEHRSFEDTLRHTLAYCDMYVEMLPPEVLFIDEQVKRYEAEIAKKNRVKKGEHTDRYNI